jgi:hypothetical protein
MRSLMTRVGTLELRVPQDHDGRFSTELFERYQRSEKALVGALAEMYVQGVSTRKVKAVTEVLCGHSFSASAISAVNKSLDEALQAFAERRLSEPFPYLILDAGYERVREAGIIISQAVLIAVAVDGEGQRQVLGVDLANRESRTSWRDFLSRLKQRGLFGVEFVVSDNHEGLKQAIRERTASCEYCWRGIPGQHRKRSSSLSEASKSLAWYSQSPISGSTCRTRLAWPCTPSHVPSTSVLMLNGSARSMSSPTWRTSSSALKRPRS